MARPGGNPNFSAVRNKDNAASVQARQDAADEFARSMLPVIEEFLLTNSGSNYRGYADWFNANGHATRRGKEWTPRQVSRLLKRITRPGFKLP